MRNLYAGNGEPLREPTQRQWIKSFILNLQVSPIKDYWHHETHAGAGALSSKFEECAVMVIDAIGEFDTASIWHWNNNKLKKVHSVKIS